MTRRKHPYEPKGPGQLTSVGTAIALLKTFSEKEPELGVSELGRRLKVAKSTAHRLATTLMSEGLLEQNQENGKYRLGIALFGLGALVRRRMNLSSEARPYLFALREATHETVHLAILDGTEIMYVYNLESPHAIRMHSDTGVRKPALSTAEGRAILAFQPPAIIDHLVGSDAAQRGAKTGIDFPGLRRALAETKTRGYAIEDEESETGMRAIAAPIRNGQGEVVGSVGVAGPVQRLTRNILANFAPQVLNTAESISVRLGFRSHSAF
jgi:IclR family transcriptional regulator, KDG regulon repressor